MKFSSLASAVGWCALAIANNFFARKVAAKISKRPKLLLKCYFPVALVINAMAPLSILRLLLKTIILPTTVLTAPAEGSYRHWENVAIPTESPGVSLAASVLRSPLCTVHGRTDQECAWIVFFNPNGMFKEGMRTVATEFSNRLGCNALIFDYRGLGRSSGQVNEAADLVKDGVAVLKFVSNTLQIPGNRVLLYGHSLGSAIAACAVAGINATTSTDALSGQAEGYSMILDRGFSSLGDVGRAYTRDPTFGGVAASLLLGSVAQVVSSAAAGVGLSPSLPFSPLAKQLTMYGGATVFGLAASASGLFQNYFVGPLMSIGGWKLETMQSLQSHITAQQNLDTADDPESATSQALLLYHGNDGIIPNTASLAQEWNRQTSIAGAKQQPSVKVVELKRHWDSPLDAHNYPSFMDKQWDVIVDWILQSSFGSKLAVTGASVHNRE